MNLHLSNWNIAPDTNVSFVKNTALDLGGALYIEPDFPADPITISLTKIPCFYQLLGCNNGSFYQLYFANNSATNGGDDIYGAPLQLPCQNSKSG